VTITWYLPFDSSWTSGIGVFGLLKIRTGVSAPRGVVRDSEDSAACE
jgi:hypothetical protein